MAGLTFNKIRHPRKRALLTAYVENGGQLGKAADAAGVHRGSHYNWLNQDEVYAEAFESAELRAGDRLEEEMRRRGVEGFERVVWYQGRPVGREQVYSDTMLAMAINGAKPDKYKHRTAAEVSGPGGRPIEHAQIEATDAELDALAEIVDD